MIDTQYFGDLNKKLSIASGFVSAHNQLSRIITEKTGVVNPVLDIEAVYKKIIKAHNKFYGLESKYDGKGNRREV